MSMTLYLCQKTDIVVSFHQASPFTTSLQVFFLYTYFTNLYQPHPSMISLVMSYEN